MACIRARNIYLFVYIFVNVLSVSVYTYAEIVKLHEVNLIILLLVFNIKKRYLLVINVFLLFFLNTEPLFLVC